MTPSNPDTPRSPLATALMLDAVQRIEADGPLDDQQALRQAFATQPTRAAQVQERAWLLCPRHYLPHEWARCRQMGSLAVAALGYGLWVVVEYFWRGINVPGYATLVVGMMFLSGVQLMSVGLLAEYVARIYDEVKQRPLFLVADEAGQGLPSDVDLLTDVASNIAGRSFCALGDAAATPVLSGIERFREEFEAGVHTPAWEAFPYEASNVFSEAGAR